MKWFLVALFLTPDGQLYVDSALGPAENESYAECVMLKASFEYEIKKKGVPNPNDKMLMGCLQFIDADDLFNFLRGAGVAIRRSDDV